MIVVMCPTTAFANDGIVTDSYVEYFDDGSYIVTEITESAITTFAAKTINRSKSSHYYNSNNTKAWTVTVNGTFNYTGSSATCTRSTASYSIYNNDWKVTSSAASKSGNKAIGAFTVKRYNLGFLTKTVNRTVTLTCSNTGVCS